MPVPSAELIYCDDALLVVNKPAGLLAVPGRGADKLDCLSARIQKEFPDTLVVRRLDMATSGLMVFARGAEMQRRLAQRFREREVAKRYVAVVKGKVEPENINGPLPNPSPEREAPSPSGEGLGRGCWGEVNLPIAADWPNRPRQKIDVEMGKHSLTRYLLLAHDADTNISRVELEPVTGRTHQLRVHMAAIGHPILGDALYGDGVAERLMLHARKLSFAHPLSGEPMTLTSEVPF